MPTMTSAKKETTASVCGTVLLAVFAGLFSYPEVLKFAPPAYNAISRLKINLGLDLQGGIHLEYKADISNMNSSHVDEALQGRRM